MPQENKSLLSRAFTRISEMIGREEPENLLNKVATKFSFYGATPTTDSSHVSYPLAKSIYYASPVLDGTTTYGEEYVFGAAFGKPIVNAIAAFAIGQLPLILIDNPDRGKGDDKQDSYTELEDEVNSWLDDNSDDVFTLVRNSFRDGDSYVEVLDDLSIDLLPASSVEKVTDDVTGKLLGYDVTNIVEKVDDKGNKTTVKYITEYRTTSPFKQTKKYEKTDNEGIVQPEYTLDEVKMTELYGEVFTSLYEANDNKWPLPIVGFHNEREPRAKYGNSEYQSVYYLMRNYHAVLEAAIKNNIYNSNAVPVLGGIENYRAFLETNGTLDEETGEYELSWDADKVILGGPGFNAKMLEGIKTAEEADKLLNIIFWLICQNSETPEFAMGTAVSSSHASVETQMPVMLRKAERKRRQLNRPLKKLIDLYIFKARLIKNTIPENVERWIKWLPILDKDLKVNTDIVKVLSEEGVITDKTKAVMLGVDDYVTDIDTEIEDAHAEIEDKAKRADVFGGRELQARKEKEFLQNKPQEEE